MRELKKKVDALEIATRITQQDLVLVTDLLRGDRTIEDVENLNPDRYNIDGIITVAKAKMEYEAVVKIIIFKNQRELQVATPFLINYSSEN